MTENDVDEIRSRLVRKIKWVHENSSAATQADYDEMDILFSRSEGSFPAEFQRIFRSINYIDISSVKASDMQRLIRVLAVIESLPEGYRDGPNDDKEKTLLLPVFVISSDSKARVFELCGDMRKIILASSDFDHPHKLRLLNRIAAIEAETHKPKGLFDVVLGGVSDIGETLGKFGRDVKPLTDRMQEILKITRRGTKEYDQLPSPDEVKQLPPPKPEE